MGKTPAFPCACPAGGEYLPNGVLKIDIIHGSCDARAAGVSLGWKGKTNCISNVLRVRGARGLLCPRLVTPVTASQGLFPC